MTKTNDHNWMKGVVIEGHPHELTHTPDEPNIVLSIDGGKRTLLIKDFRVAYMMAAWLEHAASWLEFVTSEKKKAEQEGFDDEEDDEDCI
jgi:hypothetical protein